jgi:hypothetical protein
LTPSVSVAGCGRRRDASPVADQDPHDVGQILLALSIVGGQPAERVAQRRLVERVHSSRELADGEFRVGSVLLLDDPRDVVPIAKDSAVPRRVVEEAREHGCGGAAATMLSEQGQQARRL